VGLDLDLAALRAEVISYLGAEIKPGVEREGSRSLGMTPALDAWGQDLVEVSSRGRLPPVIGREAEIGRVLQVLCGQRRSSVVLVGETGVGKTSILRGVARALARGEVPPQLQERRLVLLDLVRLLSGTYHRGRLEERIEAILRDVRRAGTIILAADGGRDFTEAGRSLGPSSVADLLRPSLTAGEVQCILTDTPAHQRHLAEHEPGLVEAFQEVPVSPASSEHTLAVVQSQVTLLQAHYRVAVCEAAVAAAVELSRAFPGGRQQPGGALDLLDQSIAGELMRAVAQGGATQDFTVDADMVRRQVSLTSGLPLERIQLRTAAAGSTGA
jgi:ATP-dependent Clp protease ATP-binding subunit ClpC